MAAISGSPLDVLAAGSTPATCKERIRNRKTERYGEPCGRELPCWIHCVHAGQVAAGYVAAFLEELIAVRDRDDDLGVRSAGGKGALAAELAASGHFTLTGAERMIWSVRAGDRVAVGNELLDRVLTALAMTDMWRTHPPFLEAAERESAAAGPMPPDPPLPPVKRKRPRGPKTKPPYRFGRIPLKPLDREQLEVVARLHLEGGLSLREIARRSWESWGYAGEQSCFNSIRIRLTRAGFARRDRVEATSLALTIHGRSNEAGLRREQRQAKGELQPLCPATRKLKGGQCTRYAVRGRVYCVAHRALEGRALEVIGR